MKTDQNHYSHEELSAFLDGDLSGDQHDRIDSHLTFCEGCQGALSELKELRNSLVRLADVELENDLWPTILQHTKTRAERRSASTWFKTIWLVPASAFVGAAAALLLVYWMGGEGIQDSKDLVNDQAKVGPVEALQVVLKAEGEYRKAIAALDKALWQDVSAFGPEVTQVVRQGIKDIDHTIDRCRQAIQSDPQNLAAQEALLAAYQHKVDFMTDLVAHTMNE